MFSDVSDEDQVISLCELSCKLCTYTEFPYLASNATINTSIE